MLSKTCTDIIDIMLNLDEQHQKLLFTEALKLQMQQSVCKEKGVEYKTSTSTYDEKTMKQTIENETMDSCMNMVNMFAGVKDLPDLNKAAIALFMYYKTPSKFTEKRYSINVTQKELTPEEFLRMHFPSVSFQDAYNEYQRTLEE